MDAMVRAFDEIDQERLVEAGGKGSSLARLYQAGYPVPAGFVIFPSAFDGKDLKPEAWEKVLEHLDRMRKEGGQSAFVVRSSACSEDSEQASFAGEFETVLNLRKDGEIRSAVQVVYRSRTGERVQAYSQAKGLGVAHEIAVVVQELVPAESSGVLFTANPINGRHDQAVINAAWGLGEAVVGGLVTPDMLIVNKTTGAVLSRETADKEVMTVLTDHQTKERPVPQNLRKASVLTDREASDLVQIGNRIEALYGFPVDIEWALAEGDFFILQARPITALPEGAQAAAVEPLPPEEWRLPLGGYMAMRNNIVEMMADPLTPLFRTLGLQAVNASMHRVLNTFFKRDIMPGDIIISVNQYAYYNGSFPMKEYGRILLDSVGIMKRMFTNAVERWTENARPHYITMVDRYQSSPWDKLSSVEILEIVRSLSEAAVDAYTALVSGVIPAAWMSEGLFTVVYNLLIRGRRDPDASLYLLGFDSQPIQGEKALYDLAEWARQQPQLACALIQTPADRLARLLTDQQIHPEVDLKDWQMFQDRFQAYLKQFGHSIYNLDFANPVPTDDPLPVLETLQLFVSGEGTNPYTRQKAAAERREQAAQAMYHRLKGWRLRLFSKNLERAQRYAPLREDGLADIGLGYPLLRQMLNEVGSRFVRTGVIARPQDIYWLEQAEVEQAAVKLDRGETVAPLVDRVPERKAVWKAARQATPPMALMQMRVWGMDLSRAKGKKVKRQNGDRLKGVAASPGKVTGPARVVNGPEDFARMQTGEILVAALTTPAWTPLFARAAGIVTDVGGPLSHGSIVAREYGIPAVLGTGAATKRIRSGQMITVDGSNGVVLLPVYNGRK